MFERSPGVGREERPPIAVVVQVQQVLSLNYLCFNNCEWLNVMFVVMIKRFSWFSDVNVFSLSVIESFDEK